MLETATELAKLVRTRSVSSRELLQQAIARYEAFNPLVNAVKQIDQATQRLFVLDEMTAQGDFTGPFHGLPITIKEAYDWIGTASTWGNPE